MGIDLKNLAFGPTVIPVSMPQIPVAPAELPLPREAALLESRDAYITFTREKLEAKRAQQKTTSGAKTAKDVLGGQGQEDLTLDMIRASFQGQYPNVPLEDIRIKGDFETGLVIYNLHDKTQFGIVPSKAFIVSGMVYALNSDGTPTNRAIRVVHGGTAKLKNLEYPMGVRQNETNRAILKSIHDALMTRGTLLRELDIASLYGSFYVGLERECWAYDPETGNLMPIPHDELLEGLLEIDEGFDVDPARLSQRMAEKMHQEYTFLKDFFGDFWITATSTPMTGALNYMKVNRDHPEMGPYIFAISEKQFPVYRAYDRVSGQIMNAYARQQGYRSFREMREATRDIRTWSMAAGHESAGLPNYLDPTSGRFVVPVDVRDNLKNIMGSALAAPLLMTNLSGPYYNGSVPRVNGKIPRDTRSLLRKMLNTAASFNEPVRSPEHHFEIVSGTITQGPKGSDRLARSAIAHTLHETDAETGKTHTRYVATAHGMLRDRTEQTGSPTGRIEMTGIGVSGIRERARVMAMLQIFQGIAIIASHEGKDSIDWIAEKLAPYGYTRKSVLGVTEKAANGYNWNGPKSRLAKKTIKMFETLLGVIDIPALAEQKALALKSLDSLRYDGDFAEYAAGKGTLGGILRELAIRGFSAEEALEITATYQRREEEFLRNTTREEAFAYLMGETGFAVDDLVARIETKGVESPRRTNG